jgi:hypothetical protein
VRKTDGLVEEDDEEDEEDEEEAEEDKEEEEEADELDGETVLLIAEADVELADVVEVVVTVLNR